MTDTEAALTRAGIEEMTRVLPLTVKHPGAAAPAQGKRVTGVPACCWAVVPISMAVAAVMLLPSTVTDPPPAIGPIPGVTVTPPGAAGTVPAVMMVSDPVAPSADATEVIEEFWITDEVMPAVVTMATTVIAGRVVPLAKDEALVVQVIVFPTAAAQTQPLP